MKTISVRIPPGLDRRLDELAAQLQVSRSAIIRQAVEAFGADRTPSLPSRAGDLVGCISGPTDLSTSPEHLDGYGE